MELAYKNIQKNFSTEECIKILESSDDIKKIAVILNLENIIEPRVAKLLIFNLTNQSGPVREACAYKLEEILPNNKECFQDLHSLNIIINALNDVNPNVVRFVLNTLKYIDNNEYIFTEMIKKINNIFNEIKEIKRRGKVIEHIYTKKCFKIYWALESIKTTLLSKKNIISNKKNLENLIDMIENIYTIEEYTIREKIAQISLLLDEKDISNIKLQLKNDRNFFVNRYFGEKE